MTTMKVNSKESVIAKVLYLYLSISNYLLKPSLRAEKPLLYNNLTYDGHFRPNIGLGLA